MISRQARIYATKFRLLEYGEYGLASTFDVVLANKMNQAGLQSNNEDQGGDYSGDGGKKHQQISKAMLKHKGGIIIDQYLKELNADLDKMVKPNNPYVSTYEEMIRRDITKAFISDCKGSRSCPHCGAFGPKIRQDNSNKVFQSPLSATAIKMNEAEGIRLLPAISKIKDEESNKNNGDDSKEENDSDSDDELHKNDPMDLDDDDDEEGVPVGKDKFMPPMEVQAQFRLTWKSDPYICKSLFSIQGSDVFFLQAIPVPPNRFRPPMHLGGMMVEHAQNGYLNKIIGANDGVRTQFANNAEAAAYEAWIELQTHVNCFMDSSKDPSSNPNPPLGIRQLLERKEGIFRKHMMGKRVNYACRSVISPDPYIGTNEIGLPRYFAETLTYPTPVTDINIAEMRNLVERGAFNYPGARWVEFPDRRVDLSKMNQQKREAIAARLLAYSKKGGKPAIVGRQLRDGDMVLMNRQVRTYFKI
jgi:DNA-directed RNA polymerase I subunit RPA1